ncbi:MAG: tetratricopeptide repeat protein [Chloroflexi bacterium]|nr:tetratricopeptide repeat protein [Chloroflexota bacterium]
MDPYVLLVFVALLFILGFGGLSWLRGEGLPGRFAWEALGFTGATLLISWAVKVPISPILFLILVYLFTMRARLLVDLGNVFSTRGAYNQALSLFHLALRLDSDAFSQAIARINMGVVWIRQKRFEEAIALLSDVLAHIPHGRGGPKYEAACRYNLGFAYLRTGQDAKAVEQFNKVIQLLPNSLYARSAEAMLQRRERDRIDNH